MMTMAITMTMTKMMTMAITMTLTKMTTITSMITKMTERAAAQTQLLKCTK